MLGGGALLGGGAHSLGVCALLGCDVHSLGVAYTALGCCAPNTSASHPCIEFGPLAGLARRQCLPILVKDFSSGGVVVKVSLQVHFSVDELGHPVQGAQHTT